MGHLGGNKRCRIEDIMLLFSYTLYSRFEKVYGSLLKLRVVWNKKDLCSESKKNKKTIFRKKMPYVGELATWDLS